jgi:hypothetical protein
MFRDLDPIEIKLFSVDINTWTLLNAKRKDIAKKTSHKSNS